VTVRASTVDAASTGRRYAAAVQLWHTDRTMRSLVIIDGRVGTA
jgi:hypothetical protein